MHGLKVNFALVILLLVICKFAPFTKSMGDDHRQLRIAHVGGLNVEIPPFGYGGLEKVVEVLIFQQLKMGHRVTLFGTKDSGQIELEQFNGKYHLNKEQLGNFRLIPSSRKALHQHTPTYEEFLGIAKKHYKAYFESFLDTIVKHVENNEFDIVHFHCMHHFEFDSPILKTAFNDRIVTTMHMALGHTDTAKTLAKYPQAKLISITNNQRTHLHLELMKNKMPNWVGTVYNGYPKGLYKYTEGQQPKKWHKEYKYGTPSLNGVPYLAFLGRFSSDKGAHHAIRIALEANMELRMAAKMNANEKVYYETVLLPMMRTKGKEHLIKYVGEINDAEKNAFLGGAKALIFPIEWQEPFGLVMIEAMAHGTPVIAPNTASVPEVVEHGVSGLIFHVDTKRNANGETMAVYTDETISQAVKFVAAVDKLDRAEVRAAFERKFSVETMANGYGTIYEKMLENIAGKSGVEGVKGEKKQHHREFVVEENAEETKHEMGVEKEKKDEKNAQLASSSSGAAAGHHHKDMAGKKNGKNVAAEDGHH